MALRWMVYNGIWCRALNSVCCPLWAKAALNRRQCSIVGDAMAFDPLAFAMDGSQGTSRLSLARSVLDGKKTKAYLHTTDVPIDLGGITLMTLLFHITSIVQCVHNEPLFFLGHCVKHAEPH